MYTQSCKMMLCLLQMTSPQWQNLEQRENYQRLIETVAVLHRLATRLSSRAEIVGAVRQVQLHMQMMVQTEAKNEHFIFHCFKIYCPLWDGMFVWQRRFLSNVKSKPAKANTS